MYSEGLLPMVVPGLAPRGLHTASCGLKGHIPSCHTFGKFLCSPRSEGLFPLPTPNSHYLSTPSLADQLAFHLHSGEWSSSSLTKLEDFSAIWRAEPQLLKWGLDLFLGYSPFALRYEWKARKYQHSNRRYKEHEIDNNWNKILPGQAHKWNRDDIEKVRKLEDRLLDITDWKKKDS